MITHGGERVTLQTGAPSLNTIGVSLGRIMRFAGHTKYPYSVLGHSLVVAAIMPPEKGIYGLMHDAQEICFSDVPTPMKSQVARNREHVVQARIYIANGLLLPLDEATVAAVEDADHAVLIAEAHVLEHPGAAAQWGADFDKEAARLTRKYQKKTIDWLNVDGERDIAGPLFVKEFKKYMKLAGLDAPGEWL